MNDQEEIELIRRLVKEDAVKEKKYKNHEFEALSDTFEQSGEAPKSFELQELMKPETDVPQHEQHYSDEVDSWYEDACNIEQTSQIFGYKDHTVEDTLSLASVITPPASEEGPTIHPEKNPGENEDEKYKLDEIKAQLDEMQLEIKTKIMMEEQYLSIIDNLHKELQMYKTNEKQDQMLPIVKDIIMIIDDLEKKYCDFEMQDKLNEKNIIKTVQDTIQDLEDVLYRQGIESIPSEIDLFNSKRHKVISTIKTNDKKLDRHIARVHKKAFEWDGRLIRHEQVTVYVYEEQPTEAGGNE